MELLKKNIGILSETGRTTDQVTVEEDCIVPDSLPDAGKIIWKKAMIKIEEIQVSDGQIRITGQMKVQVLYMDDTKEHGLHRLEETIPFQESLSLEGAVNLDQTEVRWEMEDISVSLINSRKVSIRGLISFGFRVEENCEIQTAVEIHGVSNVSTQRKKMEFLELKHRKKDIYRMKEEMVLPSSKPSVSRILWEDMQLRSMEIRPEDGKVKIRGELFVLVLYEGEERNTGLQWMEYSLPFQGSLEYPEAQTDLICETTIQMEQCDLTLENDYDGEKRKFLAEAAFRLDIHLYEEEQAEILTDVYSPVKELVPQREAHDYESLMMKNSFRIKASGKGKLSASQPRILQICSSVGEIKLDDAKMTEKGFLIEGAVLTQVLYVSSDDVVPYAVLEDAVPFQYLLEMEQGEKECHHTLQSGVEQLTVSMLDSETVEIKAVISMHLFAVREEKGEFISDIESREIDLKKIQELPGITGYLVQPQDTLWSIARKYYTTPEKICELNQMEEKDIRPGVGIVIVKTVLPN